MPRSNEVQQDLHLVFTTSVEDIRNAKKQQWQWTYYALLLMAGITYLMKTYPSVIFSLFGDVLIGGIAVIALFLIRSTENDIVTKYRDRLSEAHSRLSNTFQRVYLLPEDYLEKTYKRHYTTIISATIVMSCGLLILLTPAPTY